MREKKVCVRMTGSEKRDRKRERRYREDRVHTLRLLPRCFPFLRCCMSTEKTHTHRATNTPKVRSHMKHSHRTSKRGRGKGEGEGEKKGRKG